MAPTKKKTVRRAPLSPRFPNSMGEGGAAALSLPGDAIFDILSWVPVKSLCRFRCVCKDWLALISDPAFVVSHKRRAASEQVLVGSYCDVNRPANNSGLRVMDMEGNVLWTINIPFPVVCSSLDNLVCYSGFDAVTRVVDVTTGKVLLTSPMAIKPYAIAISIGRAALSNSTKVVRLTENSPYQPQQTCEVLTLGSVHDSLWRQAPLPPTAVLVFHDETSSAIVNGVVHFLSSTFAVPRWPADTVLCFDLETEEWSNTIQGPLKEDMDLWSKTKQVRLTVLNETLCMIQTKEYRQTNNLCSNIWIVVDGNKGIWVKTYTIPMATPFYIVEPLTVMPDGVKLLLYYRSNTSLVPVLRVYNPSVGTCTDALKLPQNTFHNIGVCNLHLDCFVTPAGSRAESTFNMRLGSLDACR